MPSDNGQASAPQDDALAEIPFFPWLVEAMVRTGVTKEMLAAGVEVYLARDRRFETEAEIVFNIYQAVATAKEAT